MAWGPHSMPQHTNGNLLVAVDTETTGLDIHKHAIVEICILPLRSDWTINKELRPFDIQLQVPEHKIATVDPKAMQVNKLNLAELQLRGFDQDKAADLLLDWFNKLGLSPNKGLMPLAQNWPFDSGFIKEWLGNSTYELIFNRHFRDTYAVANFLNDRADMLSNVIEYPKISLSYLCNILKVENVAPHRAFGDAMATAECYRKMLMGAI